MPTKALEPNTPHSERHETAYDSSSLALALSEWSELLGDEHVLFDRSSVDHISRSTLPSSTRAAAIIKPGSTEEVREAVRIASRHVVPVYPISKGKNWGYGDACAPTDGQVIMDLGRLNKILEVDEKLAYAVVEPGVTQGQMYEYLQENKLRLWLDVTGAGPDASIVGNTLERGFGHTTYGDHFAHSCGMEVVLADGSLIDTGFGAFPNAKASRVFQAGVGPYIDGLFTQSNLGIVTKLGFWLMPEPEVCEGFAFTVPEDSQVEDVVERMRELRLHDVVRSTVHIANDLRVLSARQQYPWDLTNGETPLPDKVRADLRKAAGIGAWNVMGGLYGTRETVGAAKRVIRRTFRGLARVRFFDERKLRLGKGVCKMLTPLGMGKQLSGMLESADSVYRLLRGQPCAEHLNGVFWRSKTSHPNVDPIHSGLIWISPVLPMTDTACREVLSIVEPIFERYGFEPLITMTAINTRALCCVMNVCYDKQDIDEASQAAACYDALLDQLVSRGYIPYRLSSQCTVQHKGTRRFTAKMQQAFNPEGVLAPGRHSQSRA